MTLAPDRSGRGFGLRIAPSWGTASSGVERLWLADDTARFSREAQYDNEGALQTELSYGVRSPLGRGVVAPYAGLQLTGNGDRTWRIGGRWSTEKGQRPSDNPRRVKHRLNARLGSGGFVDIERRRGQLHGVHLKEAEARNARPGVDVPAVGDPLDLLHGLMFVHEGTQALQRAAPVPADDPGGSLETEKHIVDDRRRCSLEQAQRLGP